MNTLRSKKLMTMLLVGALAVMVPTWAMAAYTAQSHTSACTTINNTADVSYSVGAFSETKTSNTASFTVGAKIGLVVERQDTTPGVTVYPGSTGKVLTFKVWNSGNVIQKYDLTAAAKASGITDPFLNANDSFDMSNAEIWIAGADQNAMTGTSGNINPDASVTVTIISDELTTGLSSGATSVYSLAATSKHENGDSVTQNGTHAVNGGACTTDTLLIDGTGTEGDGNNDGVHSDRDTYTVASGISITKASAVISDPINGTTDGTFNATTWTACSGTCPKSIPGSVVRYKATISNAAGAPSATLTSISDVLSTNLIIVNTANAASWGATPTSGGRSTVAGTLTADTSAADGLANTVSPPTAGGTLTATLSTFLPVEAGYAAGELKGGESVTVVFDVTIK